MRKDELDHYPNFRNNPLIDGRMRKKMAPYLLPLDHPMKKKLDEIFSRIRVTESKENLLAAGFTLIVAMPRSFAHIVRHPEIPGYVFKIHLDTEKETRSGTPSHEWLRRRCSEAKKIRKRIHKKEIQHFTVPDKWLYPLPIHPASSQKRPQPVILIATDMELESRETSKYAWESIVKEHHLEELYKILKRCHGSLSLIENIPYTKNGTFAFTDTERPINRSKLKKVTKFLSKPMREYWLNLINDL